MASSLAKICVRFVLCLLLVSFAIIFHVFINHSISIDFTVHYLEDHNSAAAVDHIHSQEASKTVDTAVKGMMLYEGIIQMRRCEVNSTPHLPPPPTTTFSTQVTDKRL